MVAPLPVVPSRLFGFASYQTLQPVTPLPGGSVDNEIDKTNSVIGDVITFMRQAIADDGRLKPSALGAVQVQAFIPNAQGPTVDRSLYDTAAKTFSFLDQTAGVIYFKQSNDPADWTSPGTPFSGSQGATGAQGIQGAQGNQGTIGVTGNTGLTGTAGTNGSNGATGPAGPTAVISAMTAKVTPVDGDIIHGQDSASAFTDIKITLTNLWLNYLKPKLDLIYGLLGAVTGINTQTGTTYTFVLTDQGKIVEGNNAVAQTYTVPPNSSVAFPINTAIELVCYGAGLITVAAGVGVTLRSAGALLKTRAQYSGATLYKRASDEWVLIGDLA